MSKIVLLWALVLSLLPACAFAACTPGQDIMAYASFAYSRQTLLNTHASISYTDTSGNPGQESPGAPASVQVETSVAPIAAGPATSFVAPNPGAPVYFTVARSFVTGPSLTGKCVKLAGRIRVMNGAYYLDEGSVLLTINPATGRKVGVPTQVLLRTDLLTDIPLIGSFVIIQGVCRQEPDGKPSLLPLSSAALVRLQ